MKTRQMTFNVIEVSDLMLKLNDAQSANKILSRRLEEAETRARELEEENEQLEQRLFDFELYYSKERTKPAVLEMSRN